MKNIIAVSGLPRSGSTLLMNLLGQNSNVHVTPTSGLHEVLWTTRNSWNTFQEHQADRQASSPKNLQRVLQSITNTYHDTDKNIIIDKHRSWIHSVEMFEFILEKKCKIIVPVRDISEILASFEKLFRKNANISPIPGDFLSSQTTEGRVQHWASNAGEVGIAFNRLRDIFQRGYSDRLLLIEFDALTHNPHDTMTQIWDFLEMSPILHNFDNVKQITKEDDIVNGMPGLHDIRPNVLPVEHSAPNVLGSSTYNKYKNLEFWRTLE
jgi:sulfotransferase